MAPLGMDGNRDDDAFQPRWELLGDHPRPLGDITLDLNHLLHRAQPWKACGVLGPADLTELAETAPLEGQAELLLEARSVRQEGRLVARVRGICRATLRLTCVRCLVDFCAPIEADIDAAFAVGSDPAAKNKSWRFEEDVEYLPDGTLKLRHLVEQELLLTLPMNPICLSGCAGLCAGCGADLNRAPCTCREIEPQGPFAALKSLRS
ncbi:MAG: DUF177 domain-containing protein [Magnetococcales bacterium]|nr:DUF177 domain-containing protein [Magnetococcales bacterium]MBF0260873.1 DUF177 domain-containing protein [Magnetococcales bacterium]